MSTHETRCELSRSSDCPHPDRQHPVQHLSARRAEIGGGVSVSRLLPSRQRRMIGAWCFLDHAGPARFTAGAGMRVGPHPHTGLQTFTWMIDGEVLHRDSLGHVQRIRPGQVNLMTAGRGIAHTEESLPDAQSLHAAQLWIALPAAASACDPAFDHYPDLPVWNEDGVRFTLLAGRWGPHQAPARLYSTLVGAELHSPQAARLRLPLDPAFEYGVLTLEGSVAIGERFVADELAYLAPGLGLLELELAPGTRALLLGGEPFGEEILVWWNFVGHSKAEIVQAQRDWEAGSARFGRVDGYDGPPLVAPPIPWAQG